jgi:type II secretory pathway component HofQ
VIPEAFQKKSKKWALAFAVAALLATVGAAGPAGAAVLGELRLEVDSGRVLLKVSVSSRVAPSLEEAGDKLVVHVPGGQRTKLGAIDIGAHGVKQIRFGKHPGELRVVIDLDKAVKANLGKIGEKSFEVDLGPADSEEASAPAPAGTTAGLTYRVVDVSLNKTDDRSQVVISSDGPANYRPSVKNAGKMISVLLRNSSLAWSPGNSSLSDLSVEKIAVKQISSKGEPQVRVDITLKDKLSYTINRDQNQVVVSVDRPESTEAAKVSLGDLDMLVSLDVEQADLVGTLKNLSSQAGFECQFTNALINLDPNSRLVTFRAVKRPLRGVLTTLLASNNASFDQQGNMLLFGGLTEIAAIKAALIVAEANSDGDSGQQTKIFTLKYLDATDLDLVKNSVNLVVPESVRLSTPKGFDSYFDPISHRLVVTSSAKYIKKIEKLLEHIDIRVPQVHIEGKIIEVDDNSAKSLGINWAYAQRSAGGNELSTAAFNASQGQIGAAVATYTNIQALTQLTASIDALVAKKNANIISSPSVTAKDGTLATMQSSESLVTTSQQVVLNSNGPPTITNTFISQQIPIVLKVTPRINPKDHTIEMLIHFDLSTATELPPVGSGQPAPLSQQTVDTIVTVSSGETAVIGGLNRDSTVRSSTSVPFLGDIPLIGLLFRGELVQKVKRDIIVFITPNMDAK